MTVYNNDTDYSELIKEAASSGDYVKAAQYEQSRNEKIDSENLSYQKTNDYSGWLDSTDYGTVIQNKIKNGASKESVADSLKKRVKKASGTKGMEQYAYDDIYENAVRYLMTGNVFKYDSERPEYKSNYTGEMRSVLSDIKKTEDFSYDPLDDELYGFIKSEYSKAGRRAMEDMLGSLAANTGGIASSYAASAAGQSYDYYNLQLAEKIPELYALAYNRYQDKNDLMFDRLAALSGLEGTDYKRYRDSAEDFESDREAAYEAFLSSIDNDYRYRELEQNIFESDRSYDRSIYESDRDYARDIFESDRAYEMDEAALRQKENEQQQKENQNKIDTALKKWDTLGYLDPESAAILGLPAGLNSSDYLYRRAQIQKLGRN